MSKIFKFSMIIGALCMAPAFADDVPLDVQLAQRTARAEELRAQIAHLDSELSRCRSARTNWTAATIAGGVGVAAATTGVIVQQKSINKKKAQLESE